MVRSSVAHPIYRAVLTVPLSQMCRSCGGYFNMYSPLREQERGVRERERCEREMRQ